MQGLERSMILPTWVGHAAIGLLGGLIFGWWGLPMLLHATPLERLLKSIGIRIEGVGYLVTPLVCGVIGMGIGVLVSKIADQRAAARRAAVAEGASRMGARFFAYD